MFGYPIARFYTVSTIQTNLSYFDQRILEIVDPLQPTLTYSFNYLCRDDNLTDISKRIVLEKYCLALYNPRLYTFFDVLLSVLMTLNWFLSNRRLFVKFSIVLTQCFVSMYTSLKAEAVIHPGAKATYFSFPFALQTP